MNDMGMYESSKNDMNTVMYHPEITGKPNMKME
jgi:hypothetical protein